MQLLFPPPNPSAFMVPQDLFTDGLALEINDMDNSLSSSNDSFRNATAGDYHPLWDHLQRHYWTELYDTLFLGGRSNINTTDFDSITAAQGAAEIRLVFQELLEEFEGPQFGGGLLDTNADSYLVTQFGSAAADFYRESNGTPFFPPTQRLSAWESFLRNHEIGKRRYNIFIWVWSFLLKLLGTMQQSALNKAVAQKWMSSAQLEAIAQMSSIKEGFAVQRSGEDYGRLHSNAVLNQEIDVVRGQRGDVQRRSSAKSQEVSETQSKVQETNTFLRTMIEQLETALKAVMK